MSEKRKGHVDPRLTDFYQRVKSNREKSQQYYSGETPDDIISVQLLVNLNANAKLRLIVCKTIIVVRLFRKTCCFMA